MMRYELVVALVPEDEIGKVVLSQNAHHAHIGIDNPRESAVRDIAVCLVTAIHERVWPEHTERAYCAAEIKAAGFDPKELGWPW